MTDDKVTFMHCCCEKGNLLSKPIEGKGVKITDITKEDDFTSADTVKHVIRQIKKVRETFSFIAHRALVVQRGSD